jgi:hypothetical protein
MATRPAVEKAKVNTEKGSEWEALDMGRKAEVGMKKLEDKHRHISGKSCRGMVMVRSTALDMGASMRSRGRSGRRS